MTRRPPGAGSRGVERRQQELVQLICPLVEGAGFDLEDLTVTQAGRRSVVRVIVDSDNGVALDDIAAISRVVSTELDSGDDGFGSPYTLEVTSPGVDRPLTEQRHWRRAVGRLVEWTTAEGKKARGRVSEVDGAAVTLITDRGTEQHDWTSISPARVQVEFNRPEGVGKEKRS